jgi:hypothetical protein
MGLSGQVFLTEDGHTAIPRNVVDNSLIQPEIMDDMENHCHELLEPRKLPLLNGDFEQNKLRINTLLVSGDRN